MFRGFFARFFVVVAVFVVAASPCYATTFIVPDDRELVQKSDGIITGVVLSARAVEVEPGSIETEYEIALDRVLKGPFQEGTFVRVSSPGGVLESRFTYVASSAHFQVGDEVVLFLTSHRDGWAPTDMTLGKFTSRLTSRGNRVAVRDAEDIVGWDRDGKVHKEIIRLEAEFLQFIAETVAGGTPERKSYEVEAGEVLAAPTAKPVQRRQPITNLFPAPATTYSVSFFFCDGTRVPGRWETATMDAGVPFLKNSAQNASGLGDGGVSIIEDALGAWTGDCESAVNIPYGGTAANLKDPNDNTNMVVFNDPGGHITGTWTGSGVIATAFSSGGATHTFESETWVSFSDSDVIFQNGYAGTEVSIQEAMTHEIGHGIGLRHADKHYLKSCTATPPCSISCGAETACDSGVEECASTAIMTATVNSSLGFVLQTYDMHGADALYPGTCVVVTAPTDVVATATTPTNVQVTWTASVGATSYNIYRSTDGTNFSNVGSSVTTSFNSAASADTAYLYKVTAVNGGESGFSNSDLATTVIFTDDPFVMGTTLLKAVHVTELRTAVDAVRELAALGAGSYTDPTLTVETTVAVPEHVTDLRTALDAARSALSLSAVTYGGSVTSGTAIKASHFAELQDGVK